MAVTGIVKPGEQITNAGAQVGDTLYLTKPLGTGCLTTAGGKGKTTDEELSGACESMGRLNKDAADAAREAGVHAATDVTGFGLAGHASEMAEGAGVDLRLVASRLPWLEGARRLMEAGFASGGSAKTRAHLGERLVIGAGVGETDIALATDAETSGGLLLSVAPDQAPALEAALGRREILIACIGEVVTGHGRILLDA
jgi:selenide,water dikinase